MRCQHWTTGWVIVDADGERIGPVVHHATRAEAWAAVGGRPVTRGRPLLADPRDAILRVRLTSDELAEVRRLAKRAGVSAPDYVRSLVLP